MKRIRWKRNATLKDLCIGLTLGQKQIARCPVFRPGFTATQPRSPMARKRYAERAGLFLCSERILQATVPLLQHREKSRPLLVMKEKIEFNDDAAIGLLSTTSRDFHRVCRRAKSCRPPCATPQDFSIREKSNHQTKKAANPHENHGNLRLVLPKLCREITD